MADIVGFAQFLLVSLWGCLRKRPMYSRDAILRNSGLTQRYSGCIKTYWRKSVHFLYLCFADERIKITCRRHKQISRHDLNAWHGSTATITLTHHGPVPHICVAIFSAYFPSAPDMGRWFQCSFPQCPIHGAWQTARSSPVPQIVVARPHLLSHQRPIYVARHGPLSLHVSCGKY